MVGWFLAAPHLAVRAPVDRRTHQVLRAAVIELKEGERRHRFPVVLHAGTPGRSLRHVDGPPLADSGARQNLGPCVNTAADEAVPQVSPDGRTLFFTRRYAAENTGGVRDPDDVWISRRGADGRWSPAVS